MEDLKTTIICLLVLIFLGVAITGCGGKSDEERLAELNEQMSKAETLEEIAAISEKINKLSEKIRSNTKTTKVALGKPITYRQIDDMDEKEISWFQITFGNPKVSSTHPNPNWSPVRATRGMKYFSVEADLKNLGPRAKSTYCQAKVKVNNGYIDRLRMRTKDRSNREYIGTIEPGKSQMVLFFTQIPEDTYPEEVFGELGGKWFMGVPVDEYPSDKKFSLKLGVVSKSPLNSSRRTGGSINEISDKDQANISTTKTKLKTLHSAVNQFKMDTGRFPAEDEGLLALVEQPSDVEVWEPGGYLETTELPPDGWGNEFIYELYPETGKQFQITSMGPDGKEGTRDDLFIMD